MEINANLNVGGLGGAAPAQRTTTPAAPAGIDAASFSDSAALEGALKSLPDSRPEAVGQARQLIANPNYPPLELIEKLADLLASTIGSQTK